MSKQKTIIAAICFAVFITVVWGIFVMNTTAYNKKLVEETDERTPLFPSIDFVQGWYAKTLSEQQWNDYFDLLKQFRFDTVILQNSILETDGEKYSLWQDDILGCNRKYEKTLGLMLKCADNKNISVYVGTFCPQEWWQTNFNDEFVNKLAATHTKIFASITQKYSQHKSFAGWYFSPEMYTTDKDYTANWAKLLNSVIDGIEAYGNGLPMIFSPYHSSYASRDVTTNNTFAKLLSAVHFRKGDVFAPQDGFGAKSANKQTDIGELYAFAKICRNAAENSAVTLWLNCEMFSNNPNGQRATAERLEQQFKLASAFCDKTLCFSFAHYVYKENNKTLYNDYANLLNKYGQIVQGNNNAR